ncbi:T9SS type A sorting domain-containing protein [Hymenobacter latericus]|uniref:T9SS type A sorting domain-containing protein n=1 Tax=Hymenobacter sp. YIM 151858-1 TaxID=2987688 RepID=UPI0022275924|nr:T9SS type A sorting domain-containing protein [Hymenobacter sp. YIM 151858-1]UYZ57736.1 T9SS type A sorting domain-containing protein [Hymenobacter sp. YIM 151858-1]
MFFPTNIARTNGWRELALLSLLSIAGVAAQAQGLNYTAPLAQNVTGTYADLGNSGTAIPTANTDDDNSAPQEIGFPFSYAGQSFTQFVLNTNGFIKLGNTPPSAANLFNFFTTNAADVNIISVAGGIDLQGATDQTATPTEYRVFTTGAAGNRVCTIQYKNVADKATVSGTTTIPGQFSAMQCQIKLYEATGNIELIYGTWTSSGVAAPSGQPFLIGLKAATNAGSLLASKTSSANPWSTTTFVSVTNSLVPHFVRNVAPPNAGRTYRFRPAPPNDVEVQAIYALGKLPRGLATPHTPQVVVRNVGSAAQTNVPVTLNITGATTYSNTLQIASLPVNGSVTLSFPAYTPTSLGNSTLTATVPNDDQSGNNTKTFNQTVTDNVFGAADINGAASGSVGLNTVVTATAPNPRAALLNKYNTNSARAVTAVRVYLEDANTIGRTVYGVILGSNGAILGRTPDYVATANDIASLKTFALTTPVTISSGDFYVGLVQGSVPTGGTAYFPIGTTAEVPTRPGTFFFTTGFDPAVTTPLTLVDAASSNLGAFIIEAVVNTTTGVSKALDRSVSVYPNPSSGSFSLDVRGANAKEGLQVEVLNSLGQRVYSSPVRDNFENKLELSHLAAGIYTLKVTKGSEYMVRNISIRH